MASSTHRDPPPVPAAGSWPVLLAAKGATAGGAQPGAVLVPPPELQGPARDRTGREELQQEGGGWRNRGSPPAPKSLWSPRSLAASTTLGASGCPVPEPSPLPPLSLPSPPCWWPPPRDHPPSPWLLSPGAGLAGGPGGRGPWVTWGQAWDEPSNAVFSLSSPPNLALTFSPLGNARSW